MTGKATREARLVMERLANSGVTHERLPMLDIVFDRTVQMLTESFLHLTSTEVAVQLDEIQYARFSDFMAEPPEAPVIAIVRAVAWDQSFLLMLDGNLVFTLVEILLGGSPSDGPKQRVQQRRPTSIELQLTNRIFKLIAERLSEAFEQIAEVEFRIERLEMNPQFAAITRTTSACVRSRFRLDIARSKGELQVLFPYSSLEPVKEHLSQMFVGDQFGGDRSWNRHFEDALIKSELSFDAVLHSQMTTLADVLNWKPGQTITFETSAETEVRFMLEDMEFFRGPMGRKGGKIAAQIEEINLDTEKDEPANAFGLGDL
ncbi:FliM/FliN family flagellar motor switch protein [Parvularcula lutaonensis]|uniref:Flagellar motor switch protein FliM n=1 Tax=Parvularcula lutaonensis TaxID=491923 RepID=A0ABV7MCF7_9PROT|nr:FliM/FliN family flagellar motor switch protein [Parvularcula lutaonensis]GGY50636.1 flagellar motor switch protein FliM [Parvularcula lutaonensis]